MACYADQVTHVVSNAFYTYAVHTDEPPEADMFQWVCLSLMRRYWLNVLIPHLASEWIPRCPFCSAALDRNTPTVKLIFS